MFPGFRILWKGVAPVLVPVLILVLAVLAVPVLAGADQEVIKRFSSTVEIRTDGSVRATEVIRVRLGQRMDKGIYRDFVLCYATEDHHLGYLPWKVTTVLRDNKPTPYFLTGLGNGYRLNIWDEDVTIPPGVYEYTIVYEYERWIRFLEDHDEFHWRVTGFWPWPIEAAEAVIRLPGGARSLNWEAWIADQDYGDQAVTVRQGPGQIVFRTKRALAPNEEFNVVVGLEKGVVIEPPFHVKNAHLLWATAALILSLGYYLCAWSRLGRDIPANVTTRLEPPDDLSPAGCRHLLRMGCDDACFSAAVLSCAVKGALVIEEPEPYGYVLRRTEADTGATAGLTSDEEFFLVRLFEAGGEFRIERGDHKTRNAYRALKKELRNLYGEYYRRNGLLMVPGLLVSLGGLLALTIIPMGWRLGLVVAVMALAAVFLTVALAPFLLAMRDSWQRTRAVGAMAFLSVVFLVAVLLAFGLVLGLCAVLPLWSVALVAGLTVPFVVFNRIMPTYTARGSAAMDQIEGFQAFLSSSAQYQTPVLFEHYLPYAAALDVESEWSGLHAEVLADGSWRPAWYQGGGQARMDRLGADLRLALRRTRIDGPLARAVFTLGLMFLRNRRGRKPPRR